ncbi:substrate-binding domain-containing protein [Thalassolituus pacificus]|uniref:Substrate-binding domain-containing protein n=1 Tax=Thalassolituus pacificus TaxID=2975440 RepID=A0A9X2WIQ9_9GAMM|nr:substrate-binding domain-containing protein [Thalassolituus pacificus]MCT7361108.1 substrate-binding domain-containing protein [Thalassolituus pacificus]
MHPLIQTALLLVLAIMTADNTRAEGNTFALIAKNTSDENFIEVWRGCEAAAQKNQDHCVLLGPEQEASARLQSQAIERAINSRQYRAMAISVTKSSVIAGAVSLAEIPVITFDSPFAESERSLSLSYVGTDNQQFGRDLARQAKARHPNGGSVCLMTAEHDTNLALRVLGVRRELSGNPDFADGQPLRGEGGWHEPERCLWDSGDSSQRALAQIRITLAEIKPDVMLSVGSWPLINPQAYRNTLLPFQEELRKKKPLMIIGVGKILPEYNQLMQEQLLHALVSIDFFRIGELTYNNMLNSINKKPLKAVVYTPNTIITADKPAAGQ